MPVDLHGQDWKPGLHYLGIPSFSMGRVEYQVDEGKVQRFRHGDWVPSIDYYKMAHTSRLVEWCIQRGKELGIILEPTPPAPSKAKPELVEAIKKALDRIQAGCPNEAQALLEKALT